MNRRLRRSGYFDTCDELDVGRAGHGRAGHGVTLCHTRVQPRAGAPHGWRCEPTMRALGAGACRAQTNNWALMNLAFSWDCALTREAALERPRGVRLLSTESSEEASGFAAADDLNTERRSIEAEFLSGHA